MGTRNLIAVQLDGEYKVAQYGQWDGYPDGQGVDVLGFLRRTNKKHFIKALKKTRFITDDELEQCWQKAGKSAGENFVSISTYDKFKKLFPQLSRDTGANVLSIIYASKGTVDLYNSIDFVDDSLFCEWAYVVDLDKNVLEVYEGYNQDPLPKDARFYNGKRGGEYYPVRLIASFDLDNLPGDKEFVKQLEG